MDISQTRVRFLGLPVNRMTGTFFGELKPYFEPNELDPDRDLMKELGSVLRTKCAFAIPSEGNTGEVGDIYKIPPEHWLVRNEVCGWTAMHPSDY